MITSRRLATACVLLVAVNAAGCGSKNGPAPNGAKLQGVSHGDNVTSPFTVDMKADHFHIVPAGKAQPGEGHFHILVDVPCVQGGQVIPRGPGYLHFDTGEAKAGLDLQPGSRDLCLQVATGDHVAIASPEPGVSADKTHEIKITVKQSRRGR